MPTLAITIILALENFIFFFAYLNQCRSINFKKKNKEKDFILFFYAPNGRVKKINLAYMHFEIFIGKTREKLKQKLETTRIFL